MQTLKFISVLGFIIIASGKVFNLFNDYYFTESFSLYDLRYGFLVIYIVITVLDLIKNRRKTKDEKTQM